jgi:uncharacterized integral membrane protein
MKKKRWLLDLAPGLLVGLGLIAASLIATLTLERGGWILAGPLVLALALLGADMAESRRRGSSLRPSFTAMILACTILISSLIVTTRDPRLLLTFLPVIGVTLWFPLFYQPRRAPCRLTREGSERHV